MQITERLEQIVDAVDLPVIADFDTGYGNALNALHTLKGFERAGVAGFHIEDQVFPKRCGHLEGKTVVPAEELAVKIQAIKENQIDPDLVVIARTDALAVEGYEAAVARMHTYMEAGADVAFIEAPQSVEQIEQLSKDFPSSSEHAGVERRQSAATSWRHGDSTLWRLVTCSAQRCRRCVMPRMRS